MSDDKRSFLKLNQRNYGTRVDNAEAYLGTQALLGLTDGSDPRTKPCSRPGTYRYGDEGDEGVKAEEGEV